MPKVLNIPPTLKPYHFHGVNIDYSEGASEVCGDCPFCGKNSKFYVAVKTGLWDCKVCGASGNAVTFLRQLWDASDKATEDYSELARHRGLLFPETLMHWGVCRSISTRDWIIPGYSPDGGLNQLYRYIKDRASGKSRLIPTPEMATGQNIRHGIHGVPLMDSRKGEVFICEGPWDGMALWELMRVTKMSDDGEITQTGSESASLLGGTNVLAMPGANVFHEKWTALCAGKRVCLLYDSDHPHEHNGRTVEGAGILAAKRVAALLARAEEPPESISYIKWGKDGYDPDKPTGYDVREALGNGSVSGRIPALRDLLALIEPIPADWVAGRTKAAAKSGGTEISCTLCTEWKTLVNAWRKALKWTEGLDRALSVMLASVLSTKVVGDQLWIKIIGPAACGKSTLCEALSVNRKYVLAKSTIRGFHSGFQTDREGKQDNSLVALLYDKTLVTKDGDTLLQSPNLGQILSEARDLYDSTSRTHYRNRMGKDYQGVRMTWLLCGTSSLRSIDSSELGERFLDCVIMDSIDDELEDEILWRKANQANQSMSMEADGQLETQYDPDLVKAMQLTGGYVDYLRGNAVNLLDRVSFPDTALRRCIALGKFVAYMRARPSTKQDEKAEREFGTRLVSQLVRLAKCLAVVLNVRRIDEEVIRRTTRVALDTARGRTLEIAHKLQETRRVGLETTALALLTNETDEKELRLLRFLRKIGAVENYRLQEFAHIKGRVRWRLTERLAALYAEVYAP